jgi:RNA polymerase-binding transcription factor DksA
MKHLTQTQLARLRELLDERERELRSEIRELLLQSDEQHHKDLAGLVADAADESVANLLADLDTAILDRHVQELRGIEAARGRIASGGYGICADCRGEIDFERLVVLPCATRCSVCQKKYETTHAHGGTPTI